MEAYGNSDEKYWFNTEPKKKRVWDRGIFIETCPEWDHLKIKTNTMEKEFLQKQIDKLQEQLDSIKETKPIVIKTEEGDKDVAMCGIQNQEFIVGCFVSDMGQNVMGTSHAHNWLTGLLRTDWLNKKGTKQAKQILDRF